MSLRSMQAGERERRRQEFAKHLDRRPLLRPTFGRPNAAQRRHEATYARMYQAVRDARLDPFAREIRWRRLINFAMQMRPDLIPS